MVEATTPPLHQVAVLVAKVEALKVQEAVVAHHEEAEDKLDVQHFLLDSKNKNYEKIFTYITYNSML